MNFTTRLKNLAEQTFEFIKSKNLGDLTLFLLLFILTFPISAIQETVSNNHFFLRFTCLNINSAMNQNLQINSLTMWGRWELFITLTYSRVNFSGLKFYMGPFCLLLFPI